MIRNLRSGSAKRVADVAIIGAGIAGLCLADRLRRLGKRIIVIESGDFQPDRETDHPLNTVEILDAPYNGATEGRARGLGGTSVKWGGALLPLLPEDLDSDSAQWGINWPIR